MPRLFLGFATGLLVGLLTSLSPVIAIGALLAVLVGTVMSLRRADPSHSMQLAGTLIGIGAVLAFGAINTVAACLDTADFCGNANVSPLGVLAVVTVATGTVAAALAALRRPG